MRYAKFEIENFKGIEKTEIDLTLIPKPNIFTLVGLNESGKTTILEAIDFFKNDCESEKSARFIPKKEKANFNGEISVVATLNLDEEDNKKLKEKLMEYKFTMINYVDEIKIGTRCSFKNSRFDDDKSNVEIEIVGKKGQGKIDRNLEDVDVDVLSDIKNYILNDLLPEVVYYPNFLFNFPNKIYLESLDSFSEEEKDKQESYCKILQDILDYLNKGLKLNEHVLKRAKSSDAQDKAALTATIDRMNSVVTQKIKDSWERMFGKNDIGGKEVLFNVNNDEKGYFVEIKLKEGVDTYNINERSLGFKWFFTFLLFTEFRKKRSEDAGETVFLLDEPASNLHSTAQNRLLATFETLVEDSKLIYTTHSHHLIEPKWLGGAYIVQNKGLDYDDETSFINSQSEIELINYKRFIGEYPDKSTYFQPILDKLDYCPSQLENVPNIVVLEGKNDYYTLRYLQEVIFSDIQDYQEIKLYPGRGVNALEDVFRLYLSWGSDFIGLFDADKAGKDAKVKYEKEIGVDISGSLFTLMDIDSSWDKLTMEKLFSEREVKEILKTVFGDERYTKSRLNNALQQLLIENTSITLSERTKTKFKKVFDFVKGAH